LLQICPGGVELCFGLSISVLRVLKQLSGIDISFEQIGFPIQVLLFLEQIRFQIGYRRFGGG
jgi:hypothetical protein